MGTLLRFLLFVLLGYLVIRWLKSWLHVDKPRVKGKPRSKPDNPFEGTEIEDVKFTEIPPDQTEDEKSSEEK